MRRALALLLLTAACSDGRSSGRPGPGGTTKRDAAAQSGDGSAIADASIDDGAAGADGSEGLDVDGRSDAMSAGDGAVFLDALSRPDADLPDSSSEDGGLQCGSISSVAGRVCSPEARDWIAGATVTLETMDCHGVPLTLTATSGVAGWFELDQVPPGTWTLTVQAGMFSQTYTVTVPQNGQVLIPTDQLCVRGDVVRVAVVTGFGDHIETLLTNLGIHADTFDGNSGWATSAAPFLSDLAALQRYDIVFIDCGAATTSYTSDLGPSAAQITSNLRSYVMGGGSLYASDWAVSFLALAFPQMVVPDLRTQPSVMLPFQTTELAGYAPQTIAASVVDVPLSQAIGTNQVSITFPDMSGARSANWGLLDLSTTHADVLVQGQATTCSAGATTCNQTSTPGPVVSAPLAVRFKLTPANQQGGNVYYTAFHNIAQTGTGVSDILRWIVFHL